ncbi:MAG: hypothetical protein ACLFXM_08015 [Acidimicrobiia bacterium]
MPIDVSAARTFIYANGRLLEQLVYAALYEQGDPGAVVRAVSAYQNDDGGFGHGLEPDKRSPASQPLDVEIALERLVTVGVAPSDLVTRACDHLATVADSRGAVPVLLPSIAGYPRAPHWSATDTYTPGLVPTAGIAAYVRALGIDHPWVDRAVEYCLAALEHDDLPREAHALLGVTRFLEHAVDPDRVDSLATPVAAALPGSSYFQLRPDPDSYGVTPLEFAPTPSSPARAWFDDEVIEAHLDHLQRQQREDGGWPVPWEPPSDASRCEWRAIRTFEALRTLVAYGLIPAPAPRAASPRA